MADEEEIILEDEPSEVVISDSPEDGIDDLKRQLEEAKQLTSQAQLRADESERRRQDAERVARETSNVATHATFEAREREYESIINAHSAVAAEVSSLKDQLIKAQTDGEFAEAAELQIKLGKMAAKLDRLDEGRTELENQRKVNPNQVRPVEQVRESDQQFNARPWSQAEYENVMRGYTPATAAWMRSNPKYGSDPNFRAQVQSAHGLLTARGVAPDSDDYFRGVEELTGIRTPAQTPSKETAVSSASKPTQTRVSAPPSRSLPDPKDPGNNSSTRVNLTKDQRDMAKIMFHDHKDPELAYAKHWVALRKEGRLKDGGIVL